MESVHLYQQSNLGNYDIPRLLRQATADLLKALQTLLPHLTLLGRIDSLHPDLECAADRPVVADPDLVSSILELLDTSRASIQQPIAPGRRALLLAGVVLISANVVLIGRSEGDGRFAERR